MTSPTFALVRHYRCGEGSPVRALIHADVYRTESVAEVSDLALAELVEEDAVALVEWGDRAALAFDESALVVTLDVPDPLGAPEERSVEVLGRGRWASRADEVSAVLRARAQPRGIVSDPGPRNVVAIETATETVGVAVRTAGGVEADFTLTGRRRHVETLTPALEHLLEQVGLVPGQIEAVAVDIGPGLFTGLRVGVAAAKGLAQSLGLGVIGLTSLEILTAAAGRGAAARDRAVLRRRPTRGGLRLGQRGGRRRCGDGGAVDARPLHSDPSWPRRSAPSGATSVHAVGDGALRYAEVLGAVEGVEVVRRPVVSPAGHAARTGPRAVGSRATASRARLHRSPLHA